MYKFQCSRCGAQKEAASSSSPSLEGCLDDYGSHHWLIIGDLPVLGYGDDYECSKCFAVVEGQITKPRRDYCPEGGWYRWGKF